MPRPKTRPKARSHKSHQGSRPPTRHAKGGRRLPKGGDESWQIARVDLSDVPVGPDVITPGLDELAAAIRSAPRGDDRASVSRLVIPVFPRARPVPDGYPVPVQTLLPPGVIVGFGIDIGPAFMTMSVDQLDILGITETELVSQALANLLERADQVRPGEVHRDSIAGAAVRALQTERSIGSTLVLVPDQLARLFGPTPQLFITPMRDLIIGLDEDTEPDLVAWLFAEFASQDPNCLAPAAYRFDGRQIATTSLGGWPLAPARMRRA